MPWDGREEILWTNNIGFLQGAAQRRETFSRMPHVVISDHDRFVRGESQPGENTANLPVRDALEIAVGGDVADGTSAAGLDFREDVLIGPVDENYFHGSRQSVEIGDEFPAWHIRRPNGKDVTEREHLGSLAERMPQMAPPLHLLKSGTCGGKCG